MIFLRSLFPFSRISGTDPYEVVSHERAGTAVTLQSYCFTFHVELEPRHGFRRYMVRPHPTNAGFSGVA